VAITRINDGCSADSADRYCLAWRHENTTAREILADFAVAVDPGI
jgi:hypothetical protein